MMGHTGAWKWEVLQWLLGSFVVATISAEGIPINICSSHDVTYPSFGGQLGSTGLIYHNMTKLASYQSTGAPCVTRFTVRQDSGVNFTLRQSNFRGCFNRTKSEIINAMSKTCDSRCSYIYAYDPNYFNATIKYFFDGNSWHYWAVSKRTVLSFCMSAYDLSVKRVNFSMAYEVKLKSATYVGSSEQSDQGTIRSVNFPEGYVTDGDSYTYLIQSLNQDDFVRLTFDDWDLDSLSLMEFEGANVEHVDGSDYRPVVTSTRSWVQVKFSTGNRYGTLLSRSMGFKMRYKFFTSRQEEEIDTNCGGYKLDSTGGIFQFPAVSTSYRPVRYDCIWVVKRQPVYEKLFLKLIDSTIYRSSGWEEPNRFQVYDGLTSDSKHFLSFPPENTDVAKTGFKSTEGFYIRLKGSFYQDDKFTMSFASYSSLPAGTDQCTYGMFTCTNKRCIDRSLKCDGADQCGDNSDEVSCPPSTDWSSTSSSPFSLSVSIIVPIVVAMFLVMVICLFVFLRRCQRLQRNQPARNSQVPSVSGRMARGRRTRCSQIRVTIQQEYEDAPPTYEEAIGTPPNLGYFNMAFMWSQPDMHTGLMSPPPYAEVIGGGDEETVGTAQYPVGNDPNRQLTATDSIQSRRGRDRREARVQTRSDTEGQTPGQRSQAHQPGELHIVLRRNSNTPSSGTNSLEHNQSLGRQPLRVPVESVYGNALQQRNKSKDTASPQISVTNEGAKDTPHQNTASVQAPEEVPVSVANVEELEGQATIRSAANGSEQACHPPDPASKQRGGKGHRRRHRHRNPALQSREESASSSTRGSNQRLNADLNECDSAGRSRGVLYPQCEASLRLGQMPGNNMPPRLLRQSYSQADIPTSVQWSGPPDPRRASSAARLLPDDDGADISRPRRDVRPQLSPVPQEEPELESQPQTPTGLEPPPALPSANNQAESHSQGDTYDTEEEEYRQRLSQSSQQLRLFLRRNNSEDEDMYV